jgi:hypothetical protein
LKSPLPSGLLGRSAGLVTRHFAARRQDRIRERATASGKGQHLFAPAYSVRRLVHPRSRRSPTQSLMGAGGEQPCATGSKVILTFSSLFMGPDAD